MYISHLKLVNFKSFENLQNINFTNGKNFLVGNNNVGKTTIFEAIDFLFNGLKRNQQIDDLINNEHSEKEMYIELTFSDLSDSIKNVGRLKPYITNKNQLTLKRGKNIRIINIKGEKVSSSYKTLVYKNAKDGNFYNPTGITNATKPFLI